MWETSGFTRFGADRGFANARGEEVDEYLLRLDRLALFDTIIVH